MRHFSVWSDTTVKISLQVGCAGDLTPPEWRDRDEWALAELQASEATEARRGTEKIIGAGVLASEIINRLRSLYKKAPPKRELVAINQVIGETYRDVGR
jgi:hypothetical protein